MDLTNSIEFQRMAQERKQETDYRNGWYLVDPPFAEWLLRMNTDNARNKKPPHIGNMCEDMRNGEWKKNGESIALSHGVLQNGQNRLNAVIKSGSSVWMNIIFDAEPTKRYDCGQNRSLKDELGISGRQAQIGKTILRFITGKEKTSIGTSSKFVQKELQYLKQAADIIAAGRGKVKIGAKASCGAVVAAMIKDGSMDQDELAMFFRVVNTGNIIGCTKDPSSALVLRMQLEDVVGGGSVNQKMQLEATYKALIDFKNGTQREEEYSYDCDNAVEYLKSVFLMEEATPAAA